MTFAMIAAGALLATGAPSKPATAVRALPCEQVYQFMIVPGGGVCAVPVPYVLMIPLGKLEKLKLPSVTALRGDYKIVIESEQTAASMKSFAKAMLDEIKFANENGRDIEFTTQFSGLTNGVCLQKRADPKQVIDPIVTGY